MISCARNSPHHAAVGAWPNCNKLDLFDLLAGSTLCVQLPLLWALPAFDFLIVFNSAGGLQLLQQWHFRTQHASRQTKRTNAAPLNSVNFFYFALFFVLVFLLRPKAWLVRFRGHFCYGINDLAFVYEFVYSTSARTPLRPHPNTTVLWRWQFLRGSACKWSMNNIFSQLFCSFRRLQVKRKMFVKKCYKIFFAFLVTACWVLLLQTICVLHLTANKKWRQQKISYFCLRKFSGGREFIVVVRWLNTKSKLKLGIIL